LTLPTYLVELRVKELDPVTVKALASPDEPYALLGRDVLNRFTILPYGPPLPLTRSWRCCQRMFFEVRPHSSLTRSPVSSRVQTTSRSVGVSQALHRRSDSSAVSGSLTY